MANSSGYCRLKFASTQLMLILFGFCLAAGQTFQGFDRNVEAENETIQLWKEIFHDYDERIRPFFGTDNPVEVGVSVGIVSFESISDVNLDFTVNAYLVQSWVDPRLRHDSSVRLPPTSHFVDELWIPDLIFLNAKEARLHTVTTNNRVVDIYSDGTVYLIQRLQLTLACSMNFVLFPMDQQRCPIDLTSFEYNASDLLFYFEQGWLPPVFVFDDYSKIPQFSVQGATRRNCSKNSLIGVISCIKLEFFFRRKVGYYFIHAYIPCFMLVTLSWISFWIDVRSAPARVALGITTTLTMLTTSNGIRQELPRFAYIKGAVIPGLYMHRQHKMLMNIHQTVACEITCIYVLLLLYYVRSIDVWFAVNFIFVISSLLEYALVHYIAVQIPNTKYLQMARTEKEQAHGDPKPQKKEVQKDAPFTIMNRSNFRNSNNCFSVEPVLKDQEENHNSSKDCKGPSRNGSHIFKYGWGQRIDVVCRAIFPTSYIFFVGLYFFLFQDKYDDPEFSIEYLEKAFFGE